MEALRTAHPRQTGKASTLLALDDLFNADGRYRCVHMPMGRQRIVIECKVAHGSVERTVQAGIEQTRAYMDRRTADERHLMACDRQSETSWEEKVFGGTATRPGAL